MGFEETAEGVGEEFVEAGGSALLDIGAGAGGELRREIRLDEGCFHVGKLAHWEVSGEGIFTDGEGGCFGKGLQTPSQ